MGRYTKYFSYFGLPITASIDDVKKVYRIMAMRLHPDRNSSETAHEEFTHLHYKYNTLTQYIEKGRLANNNRIKPPSNKSETTPADNTKKYAKRPNYTAAQAERVRKVEEYRDNAEFRKAFKKAALKDDVIVIAFVF